MQGGDQGEGVDLFGGRRFGPSPFSFLILTAAAVLLGGWLMEHHVGHRDLLETMVPGDSIATQARPGGGTSRGGRHRWGAPSEWCGWGSESPGGHGSEPYIGHVAWDATRFAGRSRIRVETPCPGPQSTTGFEATVAIAYAAAR